MKSERKSRRRRRPRLRFGRKRQPNMEHAHEWERALILRDIRRLDGARVTVLKLMDAYPGAYNQKHLSKALDRMVFQGDLKIDGSVREAKRWGGWGRPKRAYVLNPSREEMAA